MSALRITMNALAFQAAWLGTVGGAAVGRLWTGPVVAAALVAWHVATAARPGRELCAVVSVAALGTLWDVVPAALGLIEYRGAVAALGGAPLWIAALWLAFATTLNVSLRWLRTRPLVAAALGAVAGPLCYLAAASLGALEFTEPRAAIAAQAAAWAALVPVTVALAARFDGAAPPATTGHRHV